MQLQRKLVVGVVAVAVAQCVWAAAPADAVPRAVRTALAGTRPAWARPPRLVAPVPDATRLRVQVALPLRDTAAAERLALAVSDPANTRHGRFLTRAEFMDRFAPTRRQVDRVRRWLSAAGMRVTAVSANRHFVTAEGSVASARAAFGTGLATYRWRGRMLRAPSSQVTVPASVAGDVAAVLGLDDSTALIHPHHVVARALRPAADSAVRGFANDGAEADQQCARWWAEHNNLAVPQLVPLQSNVVCGYAGEQIQHLYGITGTGQDGTGQTVAVVDAYASPTMRTDLDRYSQLHGLPVVVDGQYTELLASTFDSEATCEPPSDWAIEEALDVEAVHTAAPGAGIVYVGTQSCLTLFDGLNEAVGRGLAGVVSNSWGIHGEDVAPAVRRQADAIFVEAALTGVSVLFSSGDSGDNQGNPPDGHPQPDWPASSPWVTAVGGTSAGIAQDGSLRFETGWESQVDSLQSGAWVPVPPPNGPFGGGATGGPSGLYAEPSWQEGVVPDDLSGHRVVPDIAALADPHTGFAIGLTVQGAFRTGSVGGTSLACPLVAALIADTQQARALRLGLATPALYRLAGDGMRDVTDVHAAIYSPTSPTGAGPGDALWETDRRTQSLQASRGFDPVTGLGVPNGQAFVDQLGR